MKFPGLVLVDGSSYLYRAFHALPPLMNSKGQPTGAIFGVVNMLRKLIQTYEPSLCAVVFDAKGETFRDKIFDQYKAHRPPMPDDLQRQVEPLHEIIRAMGIPLLMIDEVEADDVIGTLAREAAEQGLPALISTSDKDFAQLVNDKITLTNTMSGNDLDEKGVAAKFGVKPSQIIDYLTLIGDTSDNIPGVPGVGPKTAAKWLQEYASLGKIIAHAPEIKGKVGERLREHLAQFTWVKNLVTIHCHVKLDVHPKDLTLAAPDEEKLRKLYTEYELRTFLKNLAGESVTHVAEAETVVSHAKMAHEVILTESAFQDLLTQLKSAKQFALDTETNSLDITQAELVGMSFALDGNKGYYLPFLHIDTSGQLDRKTCLHALKPILENPHILKIFQHAKFDLNILALHGLTVHPIADTQLQSYVLQSHERHDMDRLSEKYLHHKTIKYEEVVGKGVKQITFDQVPLSEAAPYAAEDAQVTYQLYECFEKSLHQLPSLKKVYENIEIPLVPVLAEMERYGVLIDAECLRKQSQSLGKHLEILQAKAFDLAGQSFNLNSPKQLQEILFGKLGLPVTQKMPTGQASTSEDVLQDLSYEYELPGVILAFRSLSKLKSTYTDKLPEQISGRTGRIHTSYHQAVVPTGRLSSSDPNLQNIPIRSEEGKKIREAFIAPEGYHILSADYSQVELRIMAHLSEDQRLLDAFRHDEDIHQATASEVFGVPLEKVSALERRNAKAINFGLMYGMSAFGLAKQLGVPREAAQLYIEKYFARYPGVKAYMDRTRAKAHAEGYVETLYGRRLYLPEIRGRGPRVKASERAAINGPLQGTSADIIKRAMIAVDAWIREANLGIHMVMQVHDELVFEVPHEHIEIAKKKIIALMSQAAGLSIPLVVGIGVGPNWGEAH